VATIDRRGVHWAESKSRPEDIPGPISGQNAGRSVPGKGQRGNGANHKAISTLRFAVVSFAWVFLRFYSQNERIVKLETVKEKRLSISLFNDSNFTICFFCE
jgi:hypothetical protein